jgi:hypothetical protein
MSADPPPAPDPIPKYIRDGLKNQDARTLRVISQYAERLADHLEEQAKRELEAASERAVDDLPDGWEDDEWDDALEDAYDKADIPTSKGTLTTKTIDGRDYYYLQWREGDQVKSQYVAPVVPAD